MLVLPRLIPGKHHWLVPGYYNRPSARQIFRDNWLNLITTLICFITAVVLWKLCPPAVIHYFPYFEGIETTSAGLKYAQPLRSEYLDTIKMAAISFCVPAGVMVGMNLWVLRDHYNASAALVGLSYALSTSALLACLLKIFVGGLRPNFYEICRPAYLATDAETMYPHSYYTTVDETCTNTHKPSLNDSQMSFPSGHASSAFAGFVFLTLWLIAHFKTFGRSRYEAPVLTAAIDTEPEDGRQSSSELFAEPFFGPVPHWKLLLSATPLCTAVILALSKIRDGWHHPVDVVCGAAIGTAFALMAYKMNFQSVWDARDNHVPRKKVNDLRAVENGFS